MFLRGRTRGAGARRDGSRHSELAGARGRVEAPRSGRPRAGVPRAPGGLGCVAPERARRLGACLLRHGSKSRLALGKRGPGAGCRGAGRPRRRARGPGGARARRAGGGACLRPAGRGKGGGEARRIQGAPLGAPQAAHPKCRASWDARAKGEWEGAWQSVAGGGSGACARGRGSGSRHAGAQRPSLAPPPAQPVAAMQVAGRGLIWGQWRRGALGPAPADSTYANRLGASCAAGAGRGLPLAHSMRGRGWPSDPAAAAAAGLRRRALVARGRGAAPRRRQVPRRRGPAAPVRPAAVCRLPCAPLIPTPYHWIGSMSNDGAERSGGARRGARAPHGAARRARARAVRRAGGGRARGRGRRPRTDPRERFGHGRARSRFGSL